MRPGVTCRACAEAPPARAEVAWRIPVPTAGVLSWVRGPGPRLQGQWCTSLGPLVKAADWAEKAGPHVEADRRGTGPPRAAAPFKCHQQVSAQWEHRLRRPWDLYRVTGRATPYH